MLQTWQNDIKQRVESIRQIFCTEMKNAMPSSDNGHQKENS
jgi:hypothetical protein